MTWVLGCFALVLAAACGQQTPSASDKQAILNEIIGKWQQRMDSLHTLRVVVDGNETHHRGSLSMGAEPIKPPEDRTEPMRYVFVFDFDAGKLHKEWTRTMYNVSSGEYHRENRAMLDDGQDYQTYMPRDANEALDPSRDRYAPDLQIGSSRKLKDLFVGEEFHVFYSFDIVNIIYRGMTAHDLTNRKLDPKAFELESVSSKDGHRIAVVAEKTDPARRSRLTHRFWVDLDRDAVITRVESHSQFDMEDVLDYKDSADGWIPTRWRRKLWQGEKLQTSSDLNVTECEINPALGDDVFHVVPQPGMIVSRADGRYVIDDDGKPSKSLLDLKLEESADSGWLFWVVGGAVLLILALAGSMMLGRRRRA